jgi:DNA-binding XRE family transcriptional regulator
MTPQELRTWRRENHFTPLDLADTLALNRNTVYQWENGSREMPADISTRLAEALIKRDTAVPTTQYEPDDSVFDLSTQQPHGTVIGLQRHFWRDLTDAERIAWVEQADNPLRALPWPHWSHGWEWYPPRRLSRNGPLPAQLPHYLHKTSIAKVQRFMADLGGDLRKAVIAICRVDAPSWPDPDNPRQLIDKDDYALLQKVAKIQKET